MPYKWTYLLTYYGVGQKTDFIIIAVVITIIIIIKAGMLHSVSGRTWDVQVKLRSLENACHTLEV